MAQLALVTSLANSAATAANAAAVAEKNLRLAEATQHGAVITMKTDAWQATEYTPTQLEDWLLAVDREEAAWVANVGPAFVTYASAVAQAAATETIARAAASGVQSLTDLQSDHAYQSAVDSLMHQAQRDQQDAWYDYLDDWYEAEHVDSLAQNSAQVIFDAAAGNAATMRSVAFETADRDQHVAILLANETWNNLTPNWLGRTVAEIPYVTAYGAADVTWSTATADSARDRKSDQADFKHDYEERLADIDRDLAVSIAPLEKTRQVAYGAHQRTAWTAEVTAANARRSSEYLAIADYRTADYSSRAVAVANLATDFALPWVATQSQIATARVGWWINDAKPEFLALAADKNTADTAYQTAVNTAYATWVNTTSEAAKNYTIAQANADYTERAGNATGLQTYSKAQAVAERDYYVDHAEIRRDEFLRMTTLTRDGVAAGTISTYYGIATFNPDAPPPGTIRPELTTAANRQYGQQVLPADGARRIGVMNRRFDAVHTTQSADEVYQATLAAAEDTYLTGETAANQIRTTALAAAEGAYDSTSLNDWADALAAAALTYPSHWLDLASETAAADATYTADTVSSSANYQAEFAAIEGEFARADSLATALGTAQERTEYWKNALNDTRNSYVLSYYSTTNDYRRDALTRVVGSANTYTTLTPLVHTNPNSSSSQPATAEEREAYQAPPNSTSATAAPTGLNAPPSTPAQRFIGPFAMSSSSGLGAPRSPVTPDLDIQPPPADRRTQNRLVDALGDWQERDVKIELGRPAQPELRSMPETAPIVEGELQIGVFDPERIPTERVEKMVGDGLATYYRGSDRRFAFVAGFDGVNLITYILERYQPVKFVGGSSGGPYGGGSNVTDGPIVYRIVSSMVTPYSAQNSNATPMETLLNWQGQEAADRNILRFIENRQLGQEQLADGIVEFAIRMLPAVNTAYEVSALLENPNDPKAYAAVAISFANDVATVGSLGGWILVRGAANAGRAGQAATSVQRLQAISRGARLAGGVGMAGQAAINFAQGDKLEGSVHLSLSLLALWGVKFDAAQHKAAAAHRAAEEIDDLPFTALKSWELVDKSPENRARLGKLYKAMLAEFKAAGGTISVTEESSPITLGPLRGGHFKWANGTNHIDLFRHRTPGTRFEELKHFFQVRKLRAQGKSDLEIASLRTKIENDAHAFLEGIGFKKVSAN